MTDVGFLAPSFAILVNGTALSPAAADDVVEIAVVQEPDTLDHLSITIANDFPGMAWTAGQHARLFQEGSAVVVKLGYVSALESVFDGEVTKITATFPDDDNPTVRIEGHSRLHRLQAGSRTRTFLSMADSDIATKIASEAGLGIRAEKTSIRHTYVIQRNQTDLAFLRDRARRIGYEVRAEGRTMVFGKPKDAEAKRHTLVWRDAHLSSQPGAAPLSSVALTTNPLRQVSEVVVRGHDPVQHRAIEAKATSGDLAAVGGRSGPAVANRAFGTRRQAIVDAPVATADEARQMAVAVGNERAREFVTGTGSLIGTPDLRAGGVVELVGLGPRLNGLYYLTRTVHTMGQDGYETSFAVRRNWVG